MSIYKDYLNQIENRKKLELQPQPIDGKDLLSEIVSQIKDINHKYRAESLDFFIYNVLPGTTSAASVKAKFLQEIILGKSVVKEITVSFAFEQLSHMKGGPSIEVLLDLALSNDTSIASQAGTVLKTQVFLYEADMNRLEVALKKGNKTAKSIIQSYAKAEFFTKLPEIDEEIEIVTFVAGIGDISTDLLSPGGDAHSRSDRELHGQCLFEHNKAQQNKLIALQKQHPNKRVMLIADKGTMGVGSSRMSGVNNVALWTGIKASPYVPFINIAPIIAGTNGISPIFLTTVGVTGGIGIDLKNWVKQKDEAGNTIRDENGDSVLKEAYSVATGTVLTLNTKEKKLYKGGVLLMDISEALTPQKVEFIRAGGSYAIVFGKKLQAFAAKALDIDFVSVYANSKEVSIDGQGLTAVE
jgi:aconitate hydratase 2/2-methylisocitrate dehydratase